MERQIHGFEYQKKICEKNDLVSDKNYTGLWDAYKEETPCVVKTFKEKLDLPLADIFNNNKRDKDFYLMYSVWKGKKSNYIIENEILVDVNKWKELFQFDYYDELKHWIKNVVSNNYSYDEIWKVEMEEWKDRWGRNRIVQPRFKRDHGIQRRIQSGVSYKNLDMFLEYIEKK